MRRYLISCGGTGGHLSPGIALAEGLVARGHQPTLLISHKKVDARLIEKYPHLSFLRIPGAPFALNPVGLARFVVKQTAGFVYGCNLVRRLRPAGIIGFGGFTTASIILASALLGVPVALHEANRVPGRAIRLLGRFARRVYLPPGVRLSGLRDAAIRNVGLPVRREIVRESRETARASFGLDPQLNVLVVLGGSQGATPLNDWADNKAGEFADRGVQIYCVTGLGKRPPETREFRAPNGQAVKAIFAPFCDRMGALLSAADLVVSRAGAGTIAEIIRCATPAILVPYPFAADNHQQANALFFEKQGGGLVVAQERLGALADEVRDVIFNDELLRKFQANLQQMDRENSLDHLLDDFEKICNPPANTPLPRPTPA